MPHFYIHNGARVHAVTRTTYYGKTLLEKLDSSYVIERYKGNYPEDPEKRARAIKRFEAILFSRAKAEELGKFEAAKAAMVAPEELAKEEQELAKALAETVSGVGTPDDR